MKDFKLFTSGRPSTIRLPDDMSEFKVRMWLNNLAHNLAAVHNITLSPTPNVPGRRFESITATQAPSDACTIVVIDRDLRGTLPKDEQIHWRNIYAFVEVTSKEGLTGSNHVVTQIAEKATYIFNVQHQRSYVCALGIFGDPHKKLEYVLAVVDRAGVVHTNPVKPAGYFIHYFLRIVYAFCYGSVKSLGWDPTMTVDPQTNEVRSIQVTGCEQNSLTESTLNFDVIKLIHSSPVLYGRGTRVWIVRDKSGSFFVLKDSWFLSSNSTSEIEMIKHVEKTVNEDPEGFLFKHACPTYRIGQEQVISTDTIRGLLERRLTRVRRRIVTGPIGDPITSFRSKAEFVSVCLDLVNVLEFLNTKAGVIHGDISINNVLINRVWHHESDKSPTQLRTLASKAKILRQSVRTQSHGSRSTATVPVGDDSGTLNSIECSGMLIDCDFMRYKDKTGHQRSGTLPFMPIESLWCAPDGQFTHGGQHDLEGLLSTMITVCNYTDKAGGQLRVPSPGDEDMLLNMWFRQPQRRHLACSKSIHLEAFDQCIASTLPDYWTDFAPFLCRLIDATWKDKPYLTNSNIATHQAYRTILLEALEMYSRQEDAQPTLSPYAAVPPPKRPLQIYYTAHLSHKRQRVNSRLQDRNTQPHHLESYEESVEYTTSDVGMD